MLSSADSLDQVTPVPRRCEPVISAIPVLLSRAGERSRERSF